MRGILLGRIPYLFYRHTAVSGPIKNLKRFLWVVSRGIPSRISTNHFFTAQNRASSHPMPVQPKTHDAMRMRMVTAFGFSDLAARYAGASMIAHSASPATVYLIIKMCSGLSAIFYFPYVALLPNSSSIRNN